MPDFDLSGDDSGFDITPADYTPEPYPQSYRSHGTDGVKLLEAMNLRGNGEVQDGGSEMGIQHSAFSQLEVIS